MTRAYPYPEPKAPSFEPPESVDDCLDEAQRVARQTHNRTAMGPVEEDEEILVVTLPDQDQYVREALIKALTDEGAATVDFVNIDELIDGDLPKHTAADGWREATMFENGRASTSRTNADLATGEVTDELVDYVEKNGYDSVFCDVGQRFQKEVELGDRFKNNWLFNNWEEFVSGIWTFPGDLLTQIERRAIEPLKDASAVRITDPEGTHLEYPLSEEEAARWAEGAFLSGHLFFNPFQASAHDPDGPIMPKATGVLAGTSNHTGYFPRIELHFEDGRLVGVEGGGKYGDKIRELNEEYADAQLPGYPDTGIFWFVDTALCTVPKAFRRTSDLFDSYWQYPNITERNRNGVFHMGFGTASVTHTDEVEAYTIENEIPTGHIHVHNYFNTFEVKTGAGWEKIVDKGRITAMDDPDVRSAARKYGDPDELLTYDWIPPLPGVNCDGDYSDDYAPDPAGYLKTRLENGEPI